jgi:hypothetical protein
MVGDVPVTCELEAGHASWHSTLNVERWKAINNVAWP